MGTNLPSFFFLILLRPSLLYGFRGGAGFGFGFGRRQSRNKKGRRKGEEKKKIAHVLPGEGKSECVRVPFFVFPTFFLNATQNIHVSSPPIVVFLGGWGRFARFSPNLEAKETFPKSSRVRIFFFKKGTFSKTRIS